MGRTPRSDRGGVSRMWMVARLPHRQSKPGMRRRHRV
jgi:hypothetical protein